MVGIAEDILPCWRQKKEANERKKCVVGGDVKKSLGPVG